MFVDYIKKLEQENEILQKERESLFKLLYSIKGSNMDVHLNMQFALDFLSIESIKSYALKTFPVVTKTKDAQEHFTSIQIGNKITKVVTWRKPGINKDNDVNKETVDCLNLFAMIWDNYHGQSSNKNILHLLLDIKQFTI